MTSGFKITATSASRPFSRSMLPTVRFANGRPITVRDGLRDKQKHFGFAAGYQSIKTVSKRGSWRSIAPAMQWSLLALTGAAG